MSSEIFFEVNFSNFPSPNRTCLRQAGKNSRFARFVLVSTGGGGCLVARVRAGRICFEVNSPGIRSPKFSRVSAYTKLSQKSLSNVNGNIYVKGSENVRQRCLRTCPYFLVSVLAATLGYKTYAFKYLHLCPTLLTKFNSAHFKNLQYSICFIAIVGGCSIYCNSSL
jgi:hypothetical protein